MFFCFEHQQHTRFSSVVDNELAKLKIYFKTKRDSVFFLIQNQSRPK